MFILIVLCTLLILDSFLPPSGTKRRRHFTLYMDGDVDHDIVFCALDIWYVDHDHFFCICGYWTFFYTHECILTIFRQVIFVDICGCLFQFIEILWKCLGICAGATNVFLEIYLQVS